MAIEHDDPRLIYLPFDQVNKAQGSCEVFRDAWWIVHPEKGLVFHNSAFRKGLKEAAPQCNRDKNVAEYLRPKLYPWAEVRQIPLVTVHLS
jgi:hypothetical protein